MIDMFKYYDTYTRSRRISTYFSWNSIEVFDVFGAVRTGCGKSQTSRRIVELLMEAGLKVVEQNVPFMEQTRCGRTDKGDWLFVEPSKWKPHYDIDITGKTSGSFSVELEKQYQLYKRQNKLERILNYEKS
jgi:hypothetical protein